MTDHPAPLARYGGDFWRAHHEAWKRSDLNQREYCEAQGISLKAFGNWREKFNAEPQPSADGGPPPRDNRFDPTRMPGSRHRPERGSPTAYSQFLFRVL